MDKFLPISVLTQVVFSIIEFLLLIRIILKLFGASIQAPFVGWIYDTTQPILAPFSGIFPNQVISSKGFVLELSTLFAVLVYAFIAYLLSELVALIEVNNIKREKKEKK